MNDSLMSGMSRHSKPSRFRPLAYVVPPLVAILFQIYVQRFVPYLSYLELPLLVTVYLSLMRRQPVVGAILGCIIGLVQDSLGMHLLGVYGIVKTLVGYFSASISQRFDVENTSLRFVLSFFFFLFHQALLWVLGRGLLGQSLVAQVPQTIIFAFLNAIVAIPLFMVLDKLRVEE
jgi:rod shape-determining protein MreD